VAEAVEGLGSSGALDLLSARIDAGDIGTTEDGGLIRV
jgi:hypothetical protein